MTFYSENTAEGTEESLLTKKMHVFLFYRSSMHDKYSLYQQFMSSIIASHKTFTKVYNVYIAGLELLKNHQQFIPSLCKSQTRST